MQIDLQETRKRLDDAFGYFGALYHEYESLRQRMRTDFDLASSQDAEIWRQHDAESIVHAPSIFAFRLKKVITLLQPDVIAAEILRSCPSLLQTTMMIHGFRSRCYTTAAISQFSKLIDQLENIFGPIESEDGLIAPSRKITERLSEDGPLPEITCWFSWVTLYRAWPCMTGEEAKELKRFVEEELAMLGEESALPAVTTQQMNNEKVPERMKGKDFAQYLQIVHPDGKVFPAHPDTVNNLLQELFTKEERKKFMKNPLKATSPIYYPFEEGMRRILDARGQHHWRRKKTN